MIKWRKHNSSPQTELSLYPSYVLEPGQRELASICVSVTKVKLVLGSSKPSRSVRNLVTTSWLWQLPVATTICHKNRAVCVCVGLFLHTCALVRSTKLESSKAGVSFLRKFLLTPHASHRPPPPHRSSHPSRGFLKSTFNQNFSTACLSDLFKVMQLN